ncbi:hypothetical protein [Streptomyces sp. NPDC087212]|uniref:hypothetical protein n=1 Tax=Streptomyces sp. NPDC087212 TaxID=3365766 RepID=UPI00380FAD2C
MRQCTATAKLDPGNFARAILAGQGSLDTADLVGTSLTVECELGLWHASTHAAHTWDWRAQPEYALWARWTPDGTLEFESLRWCQGMERPEKEDGACGLFLDHALEHSWNVKDPAFEALRQNVLSNLDAWYARLTGPLD